MAAWITEGIGRTGPASCPDCPRQSPRANGAGRPRGMSSSGVVVGGWGGRETAWSERVLALLAHACCAADRRARKASGHGGEKARSPDARAWSRQTSDDGQKPSDVVEAMDNVLKEQRVEGLSAFTGNSRSSGAPTMFCWGRGSATRAQRVIEHRRYHITHITRQDGPIAALIAGFGWKAFMQRQRHTRAAVVGRGGLVLSQRISRRAHLPPPQEPCPYRPVVC